MTFTLSLGVIDLPYVDQLLPKQKKAPKKPTKKAIRQSQILRRYAGSKTTGDVASILERKYHVMEIFWEIHSKEIADIIADHMQDSLDNILMGSPHTELFPREGIPEIQKLFVKFINGREMDGLWDGVPTRAAMRGVNHRMLHPYKRRPPRPSFRDTGLYLQAFRAWVNSR